MANEALQNLRDIHLPTAISFWPLAPGWYLLMLVTAISLGLLFLGYRYLKRHRYSALRQLASLRTHDGQQENVASALSTLLRRVALTLYPREKVASLQGDAWLQFLDHTGKTTVFTTGIGRCLISAPYQRTTDIDLTELLNIAAQWIKRNT